MSPASKPVATGTVVVAAILLLLAAGIYLREPGWGVDTSKVVMVFDGSVKGLNLGAPLAFRGVKIGEVTRIDLILNSETYEVVMPVEAQIDNSRIVRRTAGASDTAFNELIDHGMRAQLQLENLVTGLLYIELDFHPGPATPLTELDSPYPQIPTVPTDLERLARNLQQLDISSLVRDTESAIRGIDELVNSPQTKAFSENMNETLGSLQVLSKQLQQQLASTGPKVNSLLQNTEQTVLKLDTEIPLIASELRQSLARIDRAVTELESVMAGAAYHLSDDSPTLYQINEAARELAGAGQALRSLAETLEQQPESILRGKASRGE